MCVVPFARNKQTSPSTRDHKSRPCRNRKATTDIVKGVAHLGAGQQLCVDDGMRRAPTKLNLKPIEGISLNLLTAVQSSVPRASKAGRGTKLARQRWKSQPTVKMVGVHGS
jgi:hypothetical protein